MEKPAVFNTMPVQILTKTMHVLLRFNAIALILMIVAYIIARYIFKVTFIGYEDLCILLVVWLYMIGGGNASYEQSHISADMLGLFIKDDHIMAIVKILRRVVGIIVLLIMLYLSVDYTGFNLMIGAKTVDLKIPMWCYYASMTVGFTLMLFFDLCYFVHDIKTVHQMKKGGCA